jgi:hypothetical protein
MHANVRGHFGTPLGAALLVGSLGAALWFAPTLLGWNEYDEFWSCAPIHLACSMMLCSGRAVQERRLWYLAGAFVGGLVVTAADMSLPFMYLYAPKTFWQLRISSPALIHFVATIISGALMGLTIGIIYRRRLMWCLLLGIVGEAVFLLMPLVDESTSHELFGFWVLAMILGNGGFFLWYLLFGGGSPIFYCFLLQSSPHRVHPPRPPPRALLTHDSDAAIDSGPLRICSSAPGDNPAAPS